VLFVICIGRRLLASSLDLLDVPFWLAVLNSKHFSFACLLPNAAVTYKFAVHDYLWYLNLGQAVGHIYPTGVEVCHLWKSSNHILLSFAMDSFMLIRVFFQKRLQISP
jgi:hypothetical protein